MKARARTDNEALKFWARFLSVFFVVLMLMVWEQVEALKLSHQMDGLRHEADQLTYENGRLSMQIHQWISPSHLDAIAREQYGMAPLDPRQRIGISTP